MGTRGSEREKRGRKYHIYALSPPKSSLNLKNHFTSLPKHERPTTDRDLFQQNLYFMNVHRAFGHAPKKKISKSHQQTPFFFQGNCHFLPQNGFFFPNPTTSELKPRVASLLPARWQKPPGILQVTPQLPAPTVFLHYSPAKHLTWRCICLFRRGPGTRSHRNPSSHSSFMRAELQRGRREKHWREPPCYCIPDNHPCIMGKK